MKDKGMGCLSGFLALAALTPSLLAASQPPKPVASPRSVPTISGTFADGAQWALRVPRHWNGTLLLFSHGYAPRLQPPELAPQGMASILEQRGYALAASSYSTSGWAIAEAVPDQMRTLDAFVHRFGKPRRTIAWGSSMGGLVTVALAEQHPEQIDAALPSCGSLAGALGMMNMALDGAFAFKTLLAARSDIRLVQVDDDRANAQRVQRVLDRAMRTPTGRARVALASALAELSTWPNFRRVAGTEEESERQLDGAAAAFAMAVFLPRVDQERRAGGVFSWNTGVDYRRQLRLSGREPWVQSLYRRAGIDLRQDLRTLNAAPRIAADPSAVAYMRAYYTPSGRLRIPMFSYHTIGDEMTANEQQGAYRDLVNKTGSGAWFADAWVARRGHCAFTPAEHLAALYTLEQRLTTGHWAAAPSTLNERAAETSLGPSGFVAYEPPAFLRPCARFAHCAGEPKPPRFTNVSESSRYVTVDDDTRLALDIYRPVQRRAAVRPHCRWCCWRPSDPEATREYSKHMACMTWSSTATFSSGCSHAVSGQRSVRPGSLTARDGRDVNDVIEWINRQSWSSGRVGMIAWEARTPHGARNASPMSFF